MIYEYMLIREMGRMRAPSWVEDGGYFQDPDSFTLVGWSPDEGVREYYIPDTVVALDRTALVARVLDIHSRYPMKDADDSTLTEEQVTAVVDTWMAQHGAGA